MKKNTIIAVGIAAGTAIITYLIQKRKAKKSAPANMVAQKSHHSTLVFSNAKNRLSESAN
ncbi:hypothetical protein BH11BAC4_BH11BAC4_16120 [soil metagenome]